MYYSDILPALIPLDAEGRHRAELERQRLAEDAERRCFACGGPAVATWAGALATLSICGSCSRDVLPALIADAALAGRPGVPSDVPFSRLALQQVTERFWAVVSCRLERTRRG